MNGPLLMNSLVSTLLFTSLVFGDDQPGNQKSARLDTQVQVQLDYLLYLPKDYDTQESWPLLLFLHGSGERGDDLELCRRQRHSIHRRIAAMPEGTTVGAD